MKFLDRPCSRCDWKFPGFHICLDMSDTLKQKIELPKKKKRQKKDRSDRYETRFGSPEHREKMSKARQNAIKTRDEQNLDRNELMERLYVDDGMTTRQLAEHFSIDQKTVMRVLHIAQDAGRLQMRPASRRPGYRANG